MKQNELVMLASVLGISYLFKKSNQKCPSGQHWDETKQKCVNNTPTCPSGQHWDETEQKCVNDAPIPTANDLSKITDFIKGFLEAYTDYLEMLATIIKTLG